MNRESRCEHAGMQICLPPCCVLTCAELARTHASMRHTAHANTERESARAMMMMLFIVLFQKQTSYTFRGYVILF